MKFGVSETARKLGKISEVMVDGFYFVHMREQCDQFAEMANAGDELAVEMMKVIDTFHRLCLHVEKASRS